MPETKEFVELNLDFDLGLEVDFYTMKRLSSSMFGYTDNMEDRYSAEGRSVLYEAYHQSRAEFRDLYNFFKNEKSSFTEEVHRDKYREFMDALWRIHNAEDKAGQASPKRWSAMWELEARCEQIFHQKWKPRYK